MIEHRVQSGDTLSRIARRYGVPMELIQQVNGIRDPNRIQVGQALMIPVSGDAAPATPTPTSVPAATPSDTPTPTAALAASPTNTPMPTIAPTDTPAPVLVEHVVQTGETLARIARRYGVSVEDIQQANNIRNPSLIHIGQRLVIPAASGVAIAFTATAPPIPTDVPTATETATLAPTETATLVPTDTPIPTPTFTPTPRPTATPTPLPPPACGGEIRRLAQEAEVVTLPSGATILVPPEWSAEEVAGVAGSLPYLSDKRMSVMIYLVGRPAEVAVDTSLGLVLTLSGADKASPVVQRVEGDKGVAVWDETTGDVHHVLVGYVVPEYTGVLATTSAFCPSATAHSAAEAEEFAQLLIRIVDSYRPAQ
jgi:LysM repeat protein